MKDFYLFLTVFVLTWVLMVFITFGGLLCRSSFGGVWSSIVIDDCSGWYIPARTEALTDLDGEGTLSPLWGINYARYLHE